MLRSGSMIGAHDSKLTAICPLYAHRRTPSCMRSGTTWRFDPIGLRIAAGKTNRQMGFPDIRIVLVTPSHPGNIGAAARALKNMGLTELVLVAPKQFPHPEATARASGADDVLHAARIVGSLGEGLAGCGFVVATTARPRDQYFRVLDVRAAAARIVGEARRAPAAVIFGPERTGLTNEELEMAHALVRIPASDSYPALNLAMAVQLTAYEIFRALNGAGEASGTSGAPADADADAAHAAADAAVGAARSPTAPLASVQEMQRLYAHVAEVLSEIDFRDRTQSGTHLMSRIRRFLQRAELDENEVHILRGILTAVQGRRRHAGER
jgi:TrmH family RNA methyltransferase